MKLKELEAMGYIVTKKGRILTSKKEVVPIRYRKGKPIINVRVGGANIKVSVHHIVAEKYCSESMGKGRTCVAFLDGDATNTLPSNLRWASVQATRETSEHFKQLQLSIEQLKAGTLHWRVAVKKHNIPGNYAYKLWKKANESINPKSTEVTSTP